MNMCPSVVIMQMIFPLFGSLSAIALVKRKEVIFMTSFEFLLFTFCVCVWRYM